MNEPEKPEPNGELEPEPLPEGSESSGDIKDLLDEMAPLTELADKIVKPPLSLSALAEPKKNSPSTRHIPMTRQQEINISKLSYQLYSENKEITADAIREIWPTDPAIYYKAGDRPSLTALQRHLPTDRFRKDMAALGIEYFHEEHHIDGLTSEQAAVISYLTDMSSTKGFQARLKDLAIKPTTWRSWMRQKPFSDAIKSFAKLSLADSISLGEVQLAAQVANGDLKAIKFVFEMEDRYNPNKQEQIDTQAMLGVMIDGVQQIFGDQPEKVRAFADYVALKAKAVKGVL